MVLTFAILLASACVIQRNDMQCIEPPYVVIEVGYQHHAAANRDKLGMFDASPAPVRPPDDEWAKG